MDRRRISIISAGAVLVLACLLLLVFNSRRTKVIPRGKMAKIYAEMLMADQWISTNPRYSSMADTTFVYRPILERYGYTEKDWRASVAEYIKDPDRYGRIVKKASDILGARRSQLEAEKSRREAVALLLANADFWKPERIFYPAGMRNPDNAVVGALRFYVDTVGGSEWRFDPYKGYDTLFKGPAWDITLKECPDSLAPADSLAAVDSLAVAAVGSLNAAVPVDSPAVESAPVDSLAREASGEAVPVRPRDLSSRRRLKRDSSMVKLNVEQQVDNAEIQ